MKARQVMHSYAAPPQPPHIARYLENVYPEMGIPGKRNSAVKYKQERPATRRLAEGRISVAELSICLHAVGGQQPVLHAGACPETDQGTVWTFNEKGHFNIIKCVWFPWRPSYEIAVLHLV